MKQKKIAISLAVVGAIAAPFVLGTYKMKPPSTRTWVPMSAEVKASVVAFMKKTNNCQEYVDGERQPALESCRFNQKALEEGGSYGYRPSIPLIWALNAAVAAVGFVFIFGMAYLLPALARRYWRWLNT